MCVKNSYLDEPHQTISYLMPCYDCCKDRKKRRNYFEEESLGKKERCFLLSVLDLKKIFLAVEICYLWF